MIGKYICHTGAWVTKEEYMKTVEAISIWHEEHEPQLTSLEGKKDDLKLKEATGFEPEKDMKTITEIKEGLNNFLKEYALVKTDMYHLMSARSSHDLSAVEEERLRALKRKIDDLQIKGFQVNTEISMMGMKIQSTKLEIKSGERPGNEYSVPPGYTKKEKLTMKDMEEDNS